MYTAELALAESLFGRESMDLEKIVKLKFLKIPAHSNLALILATLSF